jgi:uncharacterized protein YgiM (DUF1202 family)
MADIDRTGDKFSTFTSMKMPQKLALIALSLATCFAQAEESAKVKAKRVNVRGQATLNSEVVTQLKEGETIVILDHVNIEKPGPGEPAKWLKIALPTNTPVWVNASFVKEGEVASNRLNIRAGNGENFSILGRLEKGAKVQTIRTVDGWMEIVAPTNTYAFVSADLLEGPGINGKTEVKPADVADVPKKAPTKTESVEPLPTVKVESPVQPGQRPAPAAPAASAKVMNDPTPLPPPTVAIVPPPAPVETPAAPVTKPNLDPVTIPVPATPADKTVVIEPAPPQFRIITREGIVRRSVSVQAPSGYRLAAPDSMTTTINYLYVGKTGLELKWFLGRNIRVSGTESVDPRWPNMPLIEIKTLEPIDE